MENMTKQIIGIWAQDEEGVIGKDQVLPWSLPAELQHFKETTMGHLLLMGRVTFDGIGRRALPGRLSLILTRDKDYQIDNERVLIFHDVAEILDWYKGQDKNLYVIGGKQMFTLFEPYLDQLIRTDIHARYEGDTYFPSDFDWSVWREVKSRFRAKDEENPADFTIRTFEREK